jgi:predicted DNA-binding transcriptional regulator YafY
MRISRLFEIVYILMAHKMKTAKELAEHFEVSVRTVYRDVEMLAEAGIPIYASQGKGGGISLLEHFVLNKSVLSDMEQNEILIGLQSLQASRYPDPTGALAKLSLVFNKAATPWIEVDFSAWGSGAEQRDAFGLLKSAILNQRLIAFRYFGSDGKEGNRRVEPGKLIFKHKAWYLQGFCLTKQAERVFKISRMSAIELLHEPFQPGRTQEQRPPHHGSTKKITGQPEPIPLHLLLAIAPEGAYRVYDEFGLGAVDKQADGSFRVRLLLPESNWLYSHLLSFGPHLSVLEPELIRAGLRSRLAAMLAVYS